MSLSDEQDAESSPGGYAYAYAYGFGDGYGGGYGGGYGCGDAFDRGDGFIYHYGDYSTDDRYDPSRLLLSGLAMSGPAFDDLIRWSVRDEFV